MAVVAGYIGSVFQWERFIPRWQSVLHAFGVTIMHRSQLEAFQGEFEGWDNDRRAAFLQRLHPIIKDCTYTAIGTSVIKADWDDVMPADIQQLYGGVFGWAAGVNFTHARVWCERHNHHDPLEWVYEAGTCGAKQIGEMFHTLQINPVLQQQHRIKPNGWSFQHKGVVPLQSADVVAYELFKEGENGILDNHKRYPFRKSALDLFRFHTDEHSYVQFWDKPRLERWLASLRHKMREAGQE